MWLTFWHELERAIGDRGKRAYRASFLARRDGDMIQCKQEKVMDAFGAMSPQSNDVLHLAEGGPETEIMFHHGHKTCEFAMFELMDDLATRCPNIDIWGGCCGPWDKHF